MALTRPTTTPTEPTQSAEPEEQPTAQGVEQLAEQAATPEPEPAPPATQVATQGAAQPPARSAVKSQFETSMADAGFEGLTLGGLSFETIRMPGDGIFVIGQDEQQIGKEFDCVIQRSVKRYVVRASDAEDADMFYSYDPTGQVNAEGEDMSDKLQEWRIDGWEKPVIKTYLEVMAILLDIDEGGNEGERHRMMVSLSISPASVQKFSGYVAQQQYMKRALPNEYITRCQVGAKIKGKSNSFYPWVFKNIGPAPDLF